MEEILKVRFFTLSEIAKFIDEAEWHFWNSHERDLPAGVFEEIYLWRLRGKGGEFTYHYCQALSEDTGIPMELFKKYVNHEAAHLNKYKWDQPLLDFIFVLPQIEPPISNYPGPFLLP